MPVKSAGPWLVPLGRNIFMFRLINILPVIYLDRLAEWKYTKWEIVDRYRKERQEFFFKFK